MRILKIVITHEKECKNIQFSEKSNLIYSSQNSCGKTTLFRFILYGLGYSIPSLKGLNMDECTIEMTIQKDDNSIITTYRCEKDFTIKTEKSVVAYRLPRQSDTILSDIFGKEMTELSQFILVSMYVDQDKGWTLLNHGKIIGNVSFHIDDVLSTLCGDEVSNIQLKKKALQSETARYKELIRLFDRQKTLDNIVRNEIDTSVIESLQSEIDRLNVRLNLYKTELSRIEASKKSNQNFLDYIDKMRLFIKIDEYNSIRLTSNMVEPAGDLNSLLEARSTAIKMKIKEIKSQLLHKEAELDKYLEQQNMDDIIQSFSVTPLSRINLDTSTVQSSINLMDKAIKECVGEIDKKIDVSSITQKLNALIIRNATVLGVDSHLKSIDNVCRIRELKTYSGTDYKKIVLAFRLAYCSLIHDIFGITLPLILDSPKNEVDDTNISLMLKLIFEYYPNHQLMIASIYDLDYKFEKRIELKNKNKLLDEEISQSHLSDY